MSQKAFGSAGVFVCVTLGLFTRIGGQPSAIVSMLTGAAVYVVAGHALALAHPYSLSLAAALLAYLACAVLPRSRNPSPGSPPFRGRETHAALRTV